MNPEQWGMPVVGNYVSPSDATPTHSPSAIRDQVSNAEELLSGLHVTIEELEKRLDTVLIPVPPTVASDRVGQAIPGRQGSHLLGRLQILGEGHRAAIARLRDLCQRVEV